MFEFGHPWLFVLLALPVLVWRLTRPYKEPRSALRTPFFEDLVGSTGQKPARGAAILHRTWLQWLVVLPSCWTLIVVALARPQWVEEPITKIESQHVGPASASITALGDKARE